MNINRDNYEEYFLLFADNELSDQEKNIVEAFVKQHPDLAEEFLAIRQSVIKPDTDVTLENKSFLFREPARFINTGNYQEIFMLYNDNELTVLEKKETEEFLLQNPSLTSELALLQRTKLEPDNKIVFPGRRILFKRERDGKVIPLKWWKPAAAAVLLGTGIFMGIEYLQSDNSKLPGAVKNPISKKINKINSVPIAAKPAEQESVVATNNTDKKIARQKTLIKTKREELSVKKSIRLNDPVIAKNQKQPGNLPGIENIAGNEKREQDILVKEISPQIHASPVKNNEGVYPGDKMIKPEDVFTTAYTFDENTDRENYAFYNITEEKFNKSKLGGFLRKVKRIIERKSPFYKIKDKGEIAVR